MVQLLRAKGVKEALVADLCSKVVAYGLEGRYLAIVFCGDNSSSSTYVRMKQRMGEQIGLPVRVFGQEEQLIDEAAVMACIAQLNSDDACVGTILQLPLPDGLWAATTRLCCAVAPHKDVDGLGGAVLGYAQTGLFDFVPATPGAVLTLLDAYGLGDVQGKRVAVLGQSHLVGKPLSVALMQRGATVLSCNASTDQSYMKEQCRGSDYIVSCTGQVHLVNADFVRADKTQVIVDVGYGHRNGKAVGDVAFETVVDRVAAIAPVPGGVGPLTVVQLFANTLLLWEERKRLLAL